MSARPWQPWSPADGAVTPGLARVIGHRGAAHRSPENTLASLREAHRLGCRWVEFDVMLSADEVPVLIHDDTVDRTTDGSGSVARMSLAELRRLDAGAWRGSRFAGERIPTLDEALDLCLELGLAANVEIKPSPGQARATARAAVASLLRRWPADGPGLLVSSFERPALEEAAALAPGLPRGLLAEALPADWAAALQALGCTTLHLDHRRVRDRELGQLVERRVPVLFYTVNEPDIALRLLAGGAVAVFTDVPDTLLAMLPS